MNHKGPEAFQSNQFIRKLMQLAGASKDDVFFDLGCGVGQLCVIAVKEFRVERAVGIEIDKGRAKKARLRIQTTGLSDRVEIRLGDLWDSDLSEATIAYYGLTEWDQDVEDFGRKLRPGCRLVTLHLPLVGVLPDSVDYPFFMMKLPFTRTRSLSEWTARVLSIPADARQLIEELDSDYYYGYDKRKFKKLISERFDSQLP
jgi:SAM-dependent methyltransferase